MSPRFGGWYYLDTDTIDEKVASNWDGVYKIRIRRKKRGSKPIKKIKGPGQIIYIGSSYGKTIGSGIRFRLRCHLRSAEHTNKCMIKVRASYNLEFGIKITESEEARYYEDQAKETYIKEFGEYPLCTNQ